MPDRFEAQLQALHAELAVTQRRLSEIETILGNRQPLIKTISRRVFSKGLVMGLIPLAVFMVLGSGLLVAQGGIEALFIDPSGNVGIGKTNPSAKLDVKGDAAFSGNVGIGTTSPSETLEVNGDVKITGASLKNASGNDIVQTNADDWLRINPNGSYPATAFYNPVAIGTGGLAIGSWIVPSQGQLTVMQSALLAVSGGNVGIGTTSPAAKLDVNGSAAFNGNVTIAKKNTLEFGAGVPGKQSDAGKIGYQRFSDGLDIVGAGQEENAGKDRKISFWSEGGATFAGNVKGKSFTVFGNATTHAQYTQNFWATWKGGNNAADAPPFMNNGITTCPDNGVMIGAGFVQEGNRIVIGLQCSTP